MNRVSCWYQGDAMLLQHGREAAIDCAIDEHQQLAESGRRLRSLWGAWRVKGGGPIEPGAATIRLPDGREVDVLIDVRRRTRGRSSAVLGTLTSAGAFPARKAA
jgi:hypothetical protein